MDEQRNLLIVFAIVFGVLFAWNYFYTPPKAEQQSASPASAQPLAQQGQAASEGPSELTSSSAAQAEPLRNRSIILGETPRLLFATPKLRGSIALKGARLDDLELVNYRETTDPHSDPIVLFSPLGSEYPYGAEFGWIAADKAVIVPTADSLWKASPLQAPHDLMKQPLVLTWENGQGLTFEQRLTVDENYLFTIKQRVINHTDKPVILYPYGQVSRVGTPTTMGYYILHEGPLGYLNNHLEEFKYDTLKEKRDIRFKGRGGWAGFTDKYWLAALIPTQNQQTESYFRYRADRGRDVYQSGFYSQPLTVAAKGEAEAATAMFAGAKILHLLDKYEEILSVKHFDLAVDFGWFYFLTKPIFYILTFLSTLLGNFGLAILAFTVLLKALFFPLANKSYRSMAKMKQLQPKMQQLQERYADDKLKLNQELMALYKKEKVNPMAGCLPMLPQIIVFFALYKVLFVSIEMRQAPFFGWITDLSAPDPTSLFNLFGLIAWDPPSFLHIGLLPLIMGATMVIQQKLNPAPSDPIQAKMFMIMPIMFTVMLAQFPAGLVLYWTWSNILTILQQWVIMRTTRVSTAKT